MDDDTTYVPSSLTTNKLNYDETTVLDSSTVPTYEEFITKTRRSTKSTSLNPNKLRFLNSTQYPEPPSCILTDDESDDNNTDTDIHIQKTLIKSNKKCVNSPAIKQIVQNNAQNDDLLCQSLKKININSSHARTTPITKTPIRLQQKLNDSYDGYIHMADKRIQTSFVVSEPDSPNNSTNDNFNLHLSKSVIKPQNRNSSDSTSSSSSSSNGKIVSESIIESSPEREQDDKSTNKAPLFQTPLHTRLGSLCPKIQQVTSPPKPIRIQDSPTSPIRQPSTQVRSPLPSTNQNIVTTYEMHKVDNQNVLIINHQMDKKNKKKTRVSMCAEDLPATVVEQNLDDDENRLDVTRGNIVLLDSIVEIEDNEEEKKEKEVEKPVKQVKKHVSSDSESNEEAYERFLEQYRPKGGTIKEQQEVKSVRRQLKEFVVSDNHISSASGSTTTTEEASSDEHLFYIKTTNKIETKTKSATSTREKRLKSKNYKLDNSSTSESEDETRESSTSSTDSTNHSIDLEIRNTPLKESNFKTRKNSASALETVFKTPNNIKKRAEQNICRTDVKKQSSTSQSHLTKRFDFIESLSVNINDEHRHPDAIDYVKKFSNKKIKDDLLNKLYGIFNKSVFDGKLPNDMKLSWNNRLTSTAGMCKYKTENGKPIAEIHISSKVCDTPDRLRDTLVHEMCHSAVYLFHGSKNEGHGRIWQYWALKVSEVHKNIPKVSTSHNYTINKKYIFKCQDCGQEIHRFQKSIDLEKHICGRCHGRFKLVMNEKTQKRKPKKTTQDENAEPSSSSMTAAGATTNELNSNDCFQTPRKLNQFAQFVKDNYSSIKSAKKLTVHKDIMQELSKKFKEEQQQSSK